MEKIYITIKKKEETNHRGMHNLSGVFIKRGEDFEFEGKKYFSIVILYQNEKSYFFDNEQDFNNWFEKLNLAIQTKKQRKRKGKGKRRIKYRRRRWRTSR